MTYSIEPGSPLKEDSKIKKIKNYINNLAYKYNQRVLIISEVIGLRNKTKQVITLGINISVTGTVIYYVLNKSTPLAYGLASALIVYYISWFVKLVKTPYTKL